MPQDLVLAAKVDLPGQPRISSEGFLNMAKVIELEGKVDDNTRLIPDDRLAAFIARGSAELDTKTSEEQAGRLMQALLEGYPDLKPHNAKGYMGSITRAFLAYPLGVSMAVARDFPRKQEFHPRLAEVITALDAEKNRLLVLIGLAMKQRQERRRRDDAAREEEQYKATSPERRKLLAEAARQALKPMEPDDAR
jgi:hypothetical protein